MMMKKMLTLFSSTSSFVIVLLALLLFVFEMLQKHSIVALGYTYSRDDFPSDFLFGSGTSAYQVEGAAAEDGRTPSEYDTKAHSGFGSGYNGDVACDQYHKYKDDVQLMVQTGLDAYRFSISWARLIPKGRGATNPKGIEYYNNLIDELIKNGIQPHVTILHWDVPQQLIDEYGGSPNENFAKDFTEFANVCFEEFGDRVLHWTTINEPNCYAAINAAPQPKYSLGHNLLLGHAAVVNLYREKYQAKQHGLVGLSICVSWYVPHGDNEEDLIAVERVAEFIVGWFIHPLVYGDYPDIMKQTVGSELPCFSKQEIELVKGSFDFIAINSYTAMEVKDNPGKPGIAAQCQAKNVGGKYIQGVLEYFKRVYGNPPIYIHEIGLRTPRDASLSDQSRADFMSNSTESLFDAIRNGSNVKGYFQWSFLDLFELPGGFNYGFGLYYVDLNDTNLHRYPKLSARWYTTFLKGKRSFNPLEWTSSSWVLPKRKRRLSHVQEFNDTSLKQHQELVEVVSCMSGVDKIDTSNSYQIVI